MSPAPQRIISPSAQAQLQQYGALTDGTNGMGMTPGVPAGTKGTSAFNEEFER